MQSLKYVSPCVSLMATSPISEALSYDDVLLLPAESAVLPAEVDLSSRLTTGISLKAPIVSAAMDTVTEAEMAISMAQSGGIGVIHRNMSIVQQAEEVDKVKRFESGMVLEPITVDPSMKVRELREIKKQYGFSGFPVINEEGGIVGMVTNRDIRFVEDDSTEISEVMTRDLVTVQEQANLDEAKRLLHKHRIEKLVVVDDRGGFSGLITVRDINRSNDNPNSSKDPRGRLLVAAATGTGDIGVNRGLAMLEAGADVIVVDTAHGHSQGVLESVQSLREQSEKSTQIIAGNVATPEAALALIDRGANGIKVGIGPGSICTTRIVTGVGVPQFTAVMSTVEACSSHNVPVIADGGIKYSGDMAKAIASGADCVMIGSLLAGTDECPGDIILYQGRSYKQYRGMGSIGAMSQGSADRYFQSNNGDTRKLVPEGIEGRVPARGPVSNVLFQLLGGLRSSMGYTGNGSIEEMKNGCSFVKISNAGLAESHVHDVEITREAPNYRKLR